MSSSPANSFAERVAELFQEALESGHRSTFLVEACDGDDLLRDAVQELLDASARAEDSPIWKQPAILHEANSAASDDNTTALERYRLLGRIGAGGMGVVYRAVRADDEYSQQVAIKIVHWAGADEALALRFRRERQILAGLEHAHIARLLDGGTAPDGRPFLVMEYVDGIPIDRYVAERRPPLRDLLTLFRKICSAVSYAHRNLIVHRDLKPGNILVTPDGEPKLLDFGIAKLLDEAEARTQTVAGGMTLEYASPEQVRGAPATTLSDIYSLGVVLYELLTGARPYSNNAGPAELARAITTGDPEPLGARTGRRVDTDLENIVQMALRKEPERRYSSVEQFSEDLRRRVEDLPVAARGNSFSYVAGKFAKRHRMAMIAVIVTLAVLSGSIVSVLRSATLANRQGHLAESRFAQARELAKSFVFEIDPLLQAIPGTTKARQVINQRALTYLDRLSTDASGDAVLQRELATAYERVAATQGQGDVANLGDRSAARANLAKAIRLRREVLSSKAADAEDRTLLAVALEELGDVEQYSGDPAAAMVLHQEALQQGEAALAAGTPTAKLLSRAAGFNFSVAMDDVGNGVSAHLGNPAAAMLFLERGLGLSERALRSDPANPMSTANLAFGEYNFGRALLQLQKIPEALRHFERAFHLIQTPGLDLTNAYARRLAGSTTYYYALALVDTNHAEQAQPLVENVLKITNSFLRADPENVRAQLDDALVEALAGRADIAVHRQAPGFRRLDHAIGEEEKMLQRDSGMGELRSLLTLHYLWAGDALLSGRELAGAERRFSQASQLSSNTVSLHRSDANAALNLAEAQLGLSRVFSLRGNAAVADGHTQLAAAAARSVLDLHRDNAEALTLLNAAGGR